MHVCYASLCHATGAKYAKYYFAPRTFLVNSEKRRMLYLPPERVRSGLGGHQQDRREYPHQEVQETDWGLLPSVLIF